MAEFVKLTLLASKQFTDSEFNNILFFLFDQKINYFMISPLIVILDKANLRNFVNKKGIWYYLPKRLPAMTRCCKLYKPHVQPQKIHVKS
jgi:hypothetical protein